ncbi:DUF2314 domain-containing protein [Stagnihabitans tardus]|uniref:DUF2314 domain-containing protein n=1 Tax=Stagnihabitans tardus TaxID=2699202 RepID=A0AAE4Y735_9RHOB|nr:DUF2314 domain-containing protein [Stagnihabitans tardus]NBZ87091.1 DUF2314 domain-containing protein [Stagnihabitans tardus]
MKRFAIALSLLAWTSAAQAEEKIFAMASDDPAMMAATEEALATLPVFMDHVIGPRGIAKEGAVLKACVETGDAEHPSECFWFSPFLLLPDGKIAGMSLNEGVYTDKVKADAPFAFGREQVIDWGWRPGDGKAWGEYTTRVIFEAQGADAEALLGLPFSETPLPPEWK